MKLPSSPLVILSAQAKPPVNSKEDQDTGFGIRYQGADLVLSHHRSQIGALGRSVDRQKDWLI